MLYSSVEEKKKKKKKLQAGSGGFSVVVVQWNDNAADKERRERAVAHKNCVLVACDAFVSVSRMYKHCVHCLHFFSVRDFRMIAQSGLKESNGDVHQCARIFFFIHSTYFICVYIDVRII